LLTAFQPTIRTTKDAFNGLPSNTTWVNTGKPASERQTTLNFNQTNYDGVEAASAVTCVNHLQLVPDILPCQHVIT